MGQAKQRGTFEERRKQATDRLAEQAAERERQLEARRAEAQALWDSMSEEEKEAYLTHKRKQRSLPKLGAFALLPLVMMAGMGMPGHRHRRF